MQLELRRPKAAKLPAEKRANPRSPSDTQRTYDVISQRLVLRAERAGKKSASSDDLGLK